MIGSAIKRGSSELAILSVLAGEPLHGYELARRIEQQTQGVLKFTLASLYPVLYGLERRGLIRGTWQEATSGRRRRYYRLTAAGRREMKPLRAEWARLFQALDRLAGVANA